MLRTRVLFATLVCLAAVGFALAGDTPVPLATAHGEVEKVTKGTLTIRPRGTGGKFQKTLALKLTGTSRVTTVTFEKRAGKLVPVQKEGDVNDLKAKQHIAVIYTPDKAGGILLTAVAQPPKGP